tara:strand:- start:527 stop:757 length:231 start_codon:yes stop_codon:yes gene_type:complete
MAQPFAETRRMDGSFQGGNGISHLRDRGLVGMDPFHATWSLSFSRITELASVFEIVNARPFCTKKKPIYCEIGSVV